MGTLWQRKHQLKICPGFHQKLRGEELPCYEITSSSHRWVLTEKGALQPYLPSTLFPCISSLTPYRQLTQIWHKHFAYVSITSFCVERAQGYCAVLIIFVKKSCETTQLNTSSLCYMNWGWPTFIYLWTEQPWVPAILHSIFQLMFI